MASGAARRGVVIAGVSTRALAESAVRAGYACATVDAFGDLDQRARVENLALGRDLGRRYGAAAAARVARRWDGAAVAYVANFENHPGAVRRLAAGRILLGNTPATLVRARDPAAVSELVRRAGARFPATLPPGTPAADPGLGWLRKPVRGGGGSGIAPWSPGEPVRPREMLQRRLEGMPASFSFLADGRRAVLLGAARQLVGEARFGASGHRYSGGLFPLEGAALLLDRLDALAQLLTRELGLRGLNGVDFVLHAGAPWVLEVNPRYCASMELIERAQGEPLFELHVAACGGSLPDPAPLPAAGVWGKAVLYARRALAMGETRHWLARDDLRDVPHPGERIARGRPICTVLAEAADGPACLARLDGTARALEREIYGDELSAAD